MSPTLLVLRGIVLTLGVLVIDLAVAAPPERARELTETETRVGRLVSVSEDYIVIATRVDETGAARETEVEVPLRPETTVKLNGKPAKLTDLRPGDAIKITPFEGAPGVAKTLIAARTIGADDDDAKDAALRNRARLADERSARREDAEPRGLPTRRLTSGNVFLMRLPAESAAARAGLRPGDIVILVGDSDRAFDAELLRGLRVQPSGAQAGFVIDPTPRTDVRRPAGAIVDPLNRPDPDDDVDVDVEIPRD